MPAPADITGQTFGRLTAIRVTTIKLGKQKERAWLCRCDCGNEIYASVHRLRTGNTRSCGCLQSEITSHRNSTHNECKSLTYSSWAAMHARCRNPSHKSYWKYGARGISVCERWSSYEMFVEDMGRRPGRWYSIDRIDYNGNYEPNNCRWASYLEQANNTPQNVNLTALGETKSLSAWGRDSRGTVGRHIIGRRHKQGWSDAAAILAPKNFTREEAEQYASNYCARMGLGVQRNSVGQAARA